MKLNANQQLFAKLAGVAVGMFAFGYALVPFYYQICAAWEVNSIGELRAEPLNTQIDKTRTITVEFDANAHGLPWHFKPLVNHIEVHPGELATVEYEVVNERGETITAQAVASYGPERAAEYFKKIDCFCFTQQTLAPGETRRMPVVFALDPKMARDVPHSAL